MALKLKRPGGELATRPLHFFWIVDCSGSMFGEKIGAVNHAIQSVIPDMREAAESNPNAQLLVRTLRFATGASWITPEPVPIEDFAWDDLDASGRQLTNMGQAIEMVASQLRIPPMPERALPPVLVLLSDGQPTDMDNYKKSLNDLLHLPWGKKAVKIAISIGRDADDTVLQDFTGNPELVLEANNASMLTEAIRWASTAVSAVPAPPSSILSEEDSNGSHSPAMRVLNINNIPTPDDVIDQEDVW
ncbi:MAG: VWA domain-containing protein [Clostridiales bacterium]|nr:VWA domain-containing protein [Clostridiales bacterium]